MSLSEHKGTIKSFGFQSFLWTQFLSAFNDNIFRIVLSMVAVNMGTVQDSGKYVSIAGAIFILPFLLFSGYAGYLADVYNKRSVLIITKSFEMLAVAWGLFAFMSGRIELMFVGLFLMASHSAFFSPAKYGILPEALPKEDLSVANGLLEMSTFLAIVMGTAFGSIIFSVWKDRLGLIGVLMMVIAVTGSGISLGIFRVPASGSTKRFGLNPWGEIISGIRLILKDRLLLLTVSSITYFWFLGTFLQMALLLLGKETGLSDFQTGLLLTFLALGIGIGSVVAGRLSGKKIEMGLTPLGSIGMGLFAVSLSVPAGSYYVTASLLVLLAFSGGLFIVPMNTLLQHKSGKEEKGRVIATNNFINTGGILAASAVLWLVSNKLDFHARSIILFFGLSTLAYTAFITALLPDFLIRFSLWLVMHGLYRIRIIGRENIPERKGALIVANHVSFLDGLLIGACIQRFVRFMVYKEYCDRWPLGAFLRVMHVIPVSDGGKRDVLDAINRAREELKAGHVVCIFAEGMISRTGNLLPFKKGFEKIAEGLDVPIVPVHIDRVWGSVFSFKHGRFFWKFPETLLRPVTVSFGSPLGHGATAADVRHSVMELGAVAIEHRIAPEETLHARFIKTAKARWGAPAMADSSGREASYGETLTASLLLSGWLGRERPDEKYIGIILPPSIAGALSNIAVMMSGKTPVNLNFLSGADALASQIKQCNIASIITSRFFASRIKLDGLTGLVFIEDVVNGFSAFKKAMTHAIAFALPAGLIIRLMLSGARDSERLAAVVFTSGSTGMPKGVLLSHRNIIANIEGVSQVLHVKKDDAIIGVLPLFHSFGFTGTIWFPLLSGIRAVYHPNPIDAAGVGEAAKRLRGTILIGTPTFLSLYADKCAREDFAALRLVVAGAERLHKDVAGRFRERFGVEVLEGYGVTEASPVVSVNVPDVEDGKIRQTGAKPGTVGHAIPGVAVKVAHAEDRGKRLGAGVEGLLHVKGHSITGGYLNNGPARSALDQGWYDTGDIASIDEDGFITIVDRASRFSKIGGEMVPHVKVEETAHSLLEDAGCAVVSVPDERKGERLVLFHTSKDASAEWLWHGLQKTGLPKLWIPKREDIHYIDELPTGATGKVEIKALKKMAGELVKRAL